MDTLAEDLGIEFKTSKDEGFDSPTYTLEFLGILLSTYPIIEAKPSPQKT